MPPQNAYISKALHGFVYAVGSDVGVVPGGRTSALTAFIWLVQLLNAAVGQARRAEHKILLKQSDETLKGARYGWLMTDRGADESAAAEATPGEAIYFHLGGLDLYPRPPFHTIL